MMANNWKTKKEIMADYGYSEGTFYSRCKECSLLPDYRDAIIRDGGQRTYVDENRFQDFLRYRSEQYRKRMLDPHLKEVNCIANINYCNVFVICTGVQLAI